ncbi:MAG: transcriptional repressor [Flavobacteriales bacterium]|nr:transcriptional repressor [Flavobacteriales bacterium]
MYRTIKTFREKGLIHEISIGGEESSYAICQDTCSDSAHHYQHVHFKCDNCNAVYCVEVEQFPSVFLPKFKISSLEIQATGLCEKCL